MRTPIVFRFPNSESIIGIPHLDDQMNMTSLDNVCLISQNGNKQTFFIPIPFQNPKLPRIIPMTAGLYYYEPDEETCKLYKQYWLEHERSQNSVEAEVAIIKNK